MESHEFLQRLGGNWSAPRTETLMRNAYLRGKDTAGKEEEGVPQARVEHDVLNTFDGV